MNLSIYTSVYNLKKMKFSWKETFQNWISFLGHESEIVIVVNKSEDETPDLIREFFNRTPVYARKISVRIIDANISYSDPEFDGKLKALALANCVQPYAMLLDIDEVLIPSQRRLWIDLARELEMYKSFDSFLVPTVDLIGDEQHFKSIGSKFYIHRNTPNITRGVHKQAYRLDGTIDKEKSDTTELIYLDTKEIVRSRSLIAGGLPPFLTISSLESGEVPFVTHLGYLNSEQRVRQAEFWRPVWNLRDPTKEEPATTLTDLEKIPRYRHNLPSWKEQS